MNTASQMIRMARELKVDDPDADAAKTHVFVAHPTMFYDFVHTIKEDQQYAWKINPPGTDKYEYGKEVHGHFAGIQFLVSPDAPIRKIHLMKRADIRRARKAGLKL